MDTNTLTQREYQFLSAAINNQKRHEEYFIKMRYAEADVEREIQLLNDRVRNISLWIYNNQK